MTRIEAFTLGKTFGRPELNEDALVALPDRGYAVIDGITDRNGTRLDGMLSGRFASRTVMREVERFLVEGAPGAPDWQGAVAFVDRLGAAIRTAYDRLGVLDDVRRDRSLRGGCTVMAVLHVGDRLEIVAVGDSGVRIDGAETLQVLKPLDDVTSLLRREAWVHFRDAGHDPAACDRLAASFTWRGTAHRPDGGPDADPATVAEIERRALDSCRARLPGVPEEEIVDLLRNGIVFGQGGFQNVTGRALAYGALDGFDLPAEHVVSKSLPLAGVETLELFTDGYFKPGDGFGVDAWERAFEEVEAEDPHKIGAFMSTKGTTATALADDRTYLGVRLR